MPEVAFSPVRQSGSSGEPVAAILQECAEEVLATMLFSQIANGPSREDILAETLFCATISISGPLSGMFRIAVSEQAATVLATDFFGLDDAPARNSVQEVVGELANMICGSALSRIEPEALFTLGHPEPDSEAFTASGVVECFQLPEGVLAVSIELDSYPG